MQITLSKTTTTPTTKNTYYSYQLNFNSPKTNGEASTWLISKNPLIPQLSLIATLTGSIPQFNYTINPQITQEFIAEPDDGLSLGDTDESEKQLLNLIKTYHITQSKINKIYKQLNSEGILTDFLEIGEYNFDTYYLKITF